MEILLHYLRKFAHYILPTHCLLCDQPTQQAINLCVFCANSLPRLQSGCRICCLPLTDANTNICAKCLQKTPAYTTIITPYAYQWPLNRLITQLKFQHHLSYAQLLGQLLARYLYHYYQQQSERPSCIIPTPLHKLRLRERGFNQTLELAYPLAKQLHIPIQRHCVHRIRHTPPQTTLAATQRHTNMREAFQSTVKLADYVAIVDDVVTTGATIEALSGVLRTAGAKKIDVWCVARTQK